MTEIESGKYYELGSRTFVLLILQRSAIALILLVLAAVVGITSGSVGFSAQMPPVFKQILGLVPISVAGLAVIVEIIGIVATKLEYGVSKIMFDEAAFRIIRGVLSKREIALPYRRIQSVEVNQNLLQRILRVGHVAITSTNDLDLPSGGRDESDDEIVPLMDYDLAMTVAHTLTSRAEVERMEFHQGKR